MSFRAGHAGAVTSQVIGNNFVEKVDYPVFSILLRVIHHVLYFSTTFDVIEESTLLSQMQVLS